VRSEARTRRPARSVEGHDAEKSGGEGRDEQCEASDWPVRCVAGHDTVKSGVRDATNCVKHRRMDLQGRSTNSAVGVCHTPLPGLRGGGAWTSSESRSVVNEERMRRARRTACRIKKARKVCRRARRDGVQRRKIDRLTPSSTETLHQPPGVLERCRRLGTTTPTDSCGVEPTERGGRRDEPNAVRKSKRAFAAWSRSRAGSNRMKSRGRGMKGKRERKREREREDGKERKRKSEGEDGRGSRKKLRTRQSTSKARNRVRVHTTKVTRCSMQAHILRDSIGLSCEGTLGLEVKSEE
jgi:hypothetical protein